MIINYNNLVTSYLQNLHTNLRKFSQGFDFLDTWVHDENHNQSIYGIFEAAHDANVQALTLHVEHDLMIQMDRPWLESHLSKLGEVAFQRGETHIQISVHFKSQKSSVCDHPLYREAFKKFESNIHNEGSLPNSIQVQDQGVAFSCQVNKEGVVVDAKHQGATGSKRVLMDVLCDLLKSRSLQEGSEHSVIRLEHAFRTDKARYPHAGILTPTSMQREFSELSSFARKAFEEYLKRENLTEKRNFWDDRTSANWVELPKDERMKRIQTALNSSAQKFGLQKDGVTVVDLLNDVRVVLHLVQDPQMPPYCRHLIKLEREVKSLLGENRLELQMEDLQDYNKRAERSKIISKLSKSGENSLAR